jgi:hypothetical protein
VKLWFCDPRQPLGILFTWRLFWGGMSRQCSCKGEQLNCPNRNTEGSHFYFDTVRVIRVSDAFLTHGS